MSPSPSAPEFGMPDSVMPVLSEEVPESLISEALRAALDTLDHEKAAFMALSHEMLDALRPEMERMATELVRKSLSQAWRTRSRIGEPVDRTDIP